MDKIRIEVSARHCHLSQKDLDKLFGKGYQLKPMKDLSQKSQFAAQETIIVKTKDGQIDNLRILGPVRPQTQIELSMTDARKLKINPPIRLSGDIKRSVGAIIIGPKGEVKLKEGIIIAKRHIHANPAQAKKMGLSKNMIISVKTVGERSVTFHSIPVRIDDNYDLSFHIDTDEGNASSPNGVCSQGIIVK
ncbi:MAG: phosphate propanoyltransferase [Candidatus Buchananbacteria bacterium]|jgi:propanediol utilization protein